MSALADLASWRRRVLPVECWPDFRLTIHPLPWTWEVRPKFWHDDVTGPLGFWSLRWLFLHVEWWGGEDGTVRSWFFGREDS